MSSKKRVGETSYEETALGIIPRSKLIPLEIEGIKRAWDFVLKTHDHGHIPVTVSFLKKVHRIGFGFIFPEFGGKFRTIDVTVSQYSPPRYYTVPQMMEDFVRDLRVRLKHLPNIDSQEFLESLVGCLSWAHHRFLWIHPFQDYNGRIGRLLISMVLLNLHFPPVELKVETRSRRKRYIKALQKADGGEYKELETMIREAIEEAVAELHEPKK